MPISYYSQELHYKSGGFFCGYCGIALTQPPSGCQWRSRVETSATVDHIIPRSEGGKDTYENTVLCCRSCNSTKSNRSLDEFRFLCAMRDFEIENKVRFTVKQFAFLESLGFRLDIPDIKFRFEALETERNNNV